MGRRRAPGRGRRSVMGTMAAAVVGDGGGGGRGGWGRRWRLGAAEAAAMGSDAWGGGCNGLGFVDLGEGVV